MEKLAGEIHCGEAPERIWLVEHGALFTAGTSAQPAELVSPDRFRVYKTGRGGKYTYHGPGQRVAYVMLDLNKRKKDVRLFVTSLEQWVINTLGHFNIRGERRAHRVGVWVVRKDKPPMADGALHEDKIAAIGIRIRKWVTFHGIAINVEPNLEHYSGIIPCGISGNSSQLSEQSHQAPQTAQFGVTSLVDLGHLVSMSDLDIALRQEYQKIFG